VSAIRTLCDTWRVPADRQTSQSLDRGLQILRLLASSPEELSITEIAKQLGVSRPIVYRLIRPLLEYRLVAREGSRYRLGVGLVELARDATPSLEVVAMPHLRSLSDDLGQTATLTVSDQDAGEAVAIAVVEPRHAGLHIGYRVGSRHPLNKSAAGIAILAGRPPTRGERKAVRDARERGYAVAGAELQPGAFGLAAPIVVDGTATASVGVISLEQLPERHAAQRVLTASRGIAAELG
jgi:DNA-binding IclR family transcriptional regulator